MAIKKSQLYSSIWQGCDELRGGMDASQYKDYVLVLLFVRYVSDKYSGKKSAEVVVPKGGSFADLVALKGKTNIGEGINKVLSTLAEANGLRGVIDTVDFNDEDKLGRGKDMQDRLSKLVAIFENPDLDFSRNRAEGDDLLGDAHEFLMKHFAVESGKSKGQFYTPAEVSRIMAKVIGAHRATGATETVYDPTCGSGSLLLKVAAETPSGIAIYGQELDNATAALAEMNMWLHSQPMAVIKKGQSTLSNPLFLEKSALKTFDYVVANPPFSYKAWRTGFDPEHDLFDRFTGYGIPPAKSGDFAFLLHILRSMKSTGKGAVILPHGVLFRGNTEADIRTNIVKRGYIKAIIGLPANLFYGTSIPACIIVLDKENAAARTGVFIIDASKGFRKDGPKNRLREQDLHKIVDTFTRQADVPRYARMVPLAEIADPKNDFNLNLPRYIDSTEAEDLQDIDGHLRGGIPERDLDALGAYWQVLPGVRGLLFEAFDKTGGRPGYARLKPALTEVKLAIFGHAEFAAFQQQATQVFADWRKATTKHLTGFGKDGHPKALIETIAEDLLAAFRKAPLLDAYDIYQHLMDYWAETMQDDAYLIAADGWVAVPARIVETDKKGKSKDKGWACDLIPKPLIVARYFAREQAALEAKQAELEATAVALAELEEEHGGEEGCLGALDKIAKAEVNARLKEIKGDKDAKDEVAVLKRWLDLSEQETALKRAVKDQDAALDGFAYAKYPKLTEAEIKTLVVDDKWMARLSAAVQGELDRVSQTLTGRIRELAERYATPLPKLSEEVATLAARVDEHLKKMGASWK